jgi:hypothetical protein
MTHELNTTVELAGVELDVIIEFRADYVDNGIGGYEYWGAKGVHHQWEWEIQEVEGITPDGSVADAVRRHYDWSNVWLKGNRKRLRKAIKRKVAQVNKALATVDPETLVGTDALLEACGDAPEPECEPDEDYERYYENKYDRDYRE